MNDRQLVSREILQTSVPGAVKSAGQKTIL